MINLSQEIKRLQKLLAAAQSNVHYLEEQAAAYGALNVPLKIHNDLIREREKVAQFQTQLEEVYKKHHQPGNRLVPLNSEDNALSVMVIGENVHWPKDVVAEIATAFGYRTKGYNPLDLTKQIETLDLDEYRMSVIDLPSPRTFTEAFSLGAWLETVARISLFMPIILLTTQETQQIKIITRHSLSDVDATIVDTIDTDYYDHHRLVRAFRKALN